MSAWIPADDATLIAAGREGRQWAEVAPTLATPRTAKACTSRWRNIATEEDVMARVNALPPLAARSILAVRARNKAAPRTDEKVHWPTQGGDMALAEDAFQDNPRAVRDRGSPEASCRYASRPPSLSQGGQSSLG